jgi:hypothetical protein
MNPKHKRSIKIITKMIKSLNLDLSGLNVLTEVGSNNYLYTPVIACLAGAKNVYAWTGDTSHGKGDEIRNECLLILKYLGIGGNVNISINTRDVLHVQTANIITNSGFIRPIDEAFLKNVNHKTCVIPLMYEAWELRSTDIDIDACKEKGVRVAGTWESHPLIEVFSGVGPLAIKLAMNAGFEVYQNKIIIWSGDEFGEVSKKFFEQIGASNVILTTDAEILYNEAFDADFIYFCDMHGEDELIGEKGIINLDKLISSNEVLGIVHLIGQIDNEYIKDRGISVFPNKRGFNSVMSESLAYLGEHPILNLQVAGFKVAECIFKNLEHELVQNISACE